MEPLGTAVEPSPTAREIRGQPHLGCFWPISAGSHRQLRVGYWSWTLADPPLSSPKREGPAMNTNATYSHQPWSKGSWSGRKPHFDSGLGFSSEGARYLFISSDIGFLVKRHSRALSHGTAMSPAAGIVPWQLPHNAPRAGRLNQHLAGARNQLMHLAFNMRLRRRFRSTTARAWQARGGPE